MGFVKSWGYLVLCRLLLGVFEVEFTQPRSSVLDFDNFSAVLIFPIPVVYHRNMVGVEGFLADPIIDLTRYKRHEVQKRYVCLSGRLAISLTKYAALQFSTCFP